VEKYAVVIDAGSTGSRGFVFRVELYADGRKVLHSHSCGKAREGLSFFVSNSTGALNMLAPLLREAASMVPAHLHRETALYVKGTAGMRMLEEEAQEAIWDTLVRDLRWRSDLKFRIERRNFGTITGQLEAFYAVLASNYIVGSIDGNLKPIAGQGMIGAMDMGGSSTQLIMFNGTGPLEFVQESHFWSHSWLRYGSEIVRQRVLQRVHAVHISASSQGDASGNSDVNGSEGNEKSSSDKSGIAEGVPSEGSSNSTGAGAGPVQIANPCALVGHFEPLDDDTVLVGTGRGLDCISQIEHVLWADTIDLQTREGQLLVQEVGLDGTATLLPPSALQSLCVESPCAVDRIEHPPVSGRQFYAMSVYYYALDCVRTLGPEPLPHWPTPTLAELEAAVLKFCALPWADVEHAYYNSKPHSFTYPAQLPYRCLEALYIVTLLDKGFGFDRHARDITLALEVGGKEVEWTLGFVLADATFSIPEGFTVLSPGEGDGGVAGVADSETGSAAKLAAELSQDVRELGSYLREGVIAAQRAAVGQAKESMASLRRFLKL